MLSMRCCAVWRIKLMKSLKLSLRMMGRGPARNKSSSLGHRALIFRSYTCGTKIEAFDLRKSEIAPLPQVAAQYAFSLMAIAFHVARSSPLIDLWPRLVISWQVTVS